MERPSCVQSFERFLLRVNFGDVACFLEEVVLDCFIHEALMFDVVMTINVHPSEAVVDIPR